MTAVRMIDGRNRLTTRKTVKLAFVLLIIGVGVLVHFSTKERKETRPNVLLICMDTLRRDHVGFMGYDRPVSPNLDALAAEGAVFTNAYSQSGWTMPSMGTIFTGLYPHAHGATDFHRAMNRRLPTLASVLRDNGYDARAFVSHVLLTAEYGFNKGFVEYDYSVLRIGHPHNTSTATRLTELAIADLDKLQEPFFMWVHYFDPHFEYLSHEEWASFGDEDVDRYDQEIAHTDREIGKLFAALEARGMRNNTIVVFTSDHGEEFREHGGDFHYTSYQEVMQVPLFIAGPGVERGERTVMAEQIDFLPTILTLLGISEMPEGLPGKDILDPAAEDRPVFMERDRPPGHHQRAIIDGDFKLIAVALSDTNLIPWASRGTFAEVLNVHNDTYVFDIATDPGETENIYAPGTEPTDELLAKLAAFMEDRGTESDAVEMDEATREKLRALGYVQ